MSKTEILQNLKEGDASSIARELGYSTDLVRKTFRGERNGDASAPKIWEMAEVLALENIRRNRAIAKAGEEITEKYAQQQS